MRSVLLPAMVLSLLGTAGPPARADDPLVEKVKLSIDNGKKYLLGQQRRENGSWETTGHSLGYPGGTTSLVMLALLTAGVPPGDPAIQDGLKYLRTIAPSKTYVVALQTMVYSQAGQAVDRERIQKNIDWLVAHHKPTGWGYGDDAFTDNSNTQYALLGLHAGIEAGLPVDKQALEKVRQYMLTTQTGGGWRYRPGQPPTMTMTCAGLCNLMITGMDLDVSKQRMEGGVVKNCGVYDTNGPAANALAWIGNRFPAEIRADNTSHWLGQAPFYCMYGLERTGRLTGQRFFGGNDWYEVGCRYLVGIQKGDGSWQGNGGLDSPPAIATSFALLFLAKGRTPVLLTKLAYGPRDYEGWNNKHSDVRHLVEFASRELFKRQPLAWQIFDVRGGVKAETVAERSHLAAELLPSPIVYFNGHDMAPPDSREREILKEYVQNGGFILAEACCGREAFRRSFEKLMREILPNSELRLLPDDHPIWTASGKFLVTPNKPFSLYGVQHGCKWVAILSPQPLAYYWEANDFDKSEEGRIAFQLAANIIAYATGLEPPRPRLTEVEIPRDDGPERVRRGYLKVGQLRYDGDWQPAPKAMRNLMSEVRKAGLDVVLETTPVFPSSVNNLQHRFLYMHGRSAFEERAQDLKPLHFNLTSGGLLLADACCGSPRFDAAFRKFMEVLWAEDKLKLEPIPPTDELYSAELNGKKIVSVRCRRPGADGKGVDPAYRDVAPALEGIKYNGRWVVIYSKYDLGCALEHTTSSDCLGHDYDSAVRLGTAAVLYALKR
jgi:hypothetical protein